MGNNKSFLSGTSINSVYHPEDLRHSFVVQDFVKSFFSASVELKYIQLLYLSSSSLKEIFRQNGLRIPSSFPSDLFEFRNILNISNSHFDNEGRSLTPIPMESANLITAAVSQIASPEKVSSLLYRMMLTPDSQVSLLDYIENIKCNHVLLGKILRAVEYSVGGNASCFPKITNWVSRLEGIKPVVDLLYHQIELLAPSYEWNRLSDIISDKDEPEALLALAINHACLILLSRKRYAAVRQLTEVSLEFFQSTFVVISSDYWAFMSFYQARSLLAAGYDSEVIESLCYFVGAASKGILNSLGMINEDKVSPSKAVLLYCLENIPEASDDFIYYFGKEILERGIVGPGETSEFVKSKMFESRLVCQDYNSSVQIVSSVSDTDSKIGLLRKLLLSMREDGHGNDILKINWGSLEPLVENFLQKSLREIGDFEFLAKWYLSLGMPREAGEALHSFWHLNDCIPSKDCLYALSLGCAIIANLDADAARFVLFQDRVLDFESMKREEWVCRSALHVGLIDCPPSIKEIFGLLLKNGLVSDAIQGLKYFPDRLGLLIQFLVDTLVDIQMSGVYPSCFEEFVPDSSPDDTGSPADSFLKLLFARLISHLGLKEKGLCFREFSIQMLRYIMKNPKRLLLPEWLQEEYINFDCNSFIRLLCEYGELELMLQLLKSNGDGLVNKLTPGTLAAIDLATE